MDRIMKAPCATGGGASGAIGNGNGPDEHEPDIADLNKRLAGIRGRVEAEVSAERQA
jgi:hypothetical protein